MSVFGRFGGDRWTEAVLAAVISLALVLMLASTVGIISLRLCDVQPMFDVGNLPYERGIANSEDLTPTHTRFMTAE